MPTSIPSNQLLDHERQFTQNEASFGPAAAALIAEACGTPLSRDFLASLDFADLLGILCVAPVGSQLYSRATETLLRCDDPLLDWYEALRILVAHYPSSVDVGAVDEGEIPEVRPNATRAAIYARLNLAPEVGAAWESLFSGRTGESCQAVVDTLLPAVEWLPAGIALLLSQLNTGPTSPANAVLAKYAARTRQPNDLVRELIYLYHLKPWRDSSPILIFAVSQSTSTSELRDIARAAAEHPNVLQAVAKQWASIQLEQRAA